MMKRIQEGQPFFVIVDAADTPAKLEKLFRHIRKMLPKNGKILGVMEKSGKKVRKQQLSRVAGRYCSSVYYTPCEGSRESRMTVIENAFRHADFSDCVLILGGESSLVREAARQVAYELDLLD